MKPASEWKLGKRQAETLELFAELGCIKLVADRMGVCTSTVWEQIRHARVKSGLRFTLQVVIAWDRHLQAIAKAQACASTQSEENGR